MHWIFPAASIMKCTVLAKIYTRLPGIVDKKYCIQKRSALRDEV